MNTTTTNQTPNLAELALAMAMSGQSWEQFTDSVADKVASRLMGFTPDKREINAIADGEKPLRGVRALCRHLGISSATAIKLMKGGLIPCRRIGNRYFFYPTEVNAAVRGGVL